MHQFSVGCINSVGTNILIIIITEVDAAGPVIGGTTGAVALLGFIILFIIACLIYRKRRREKKLWALPMRYIV